ncbi:MAG: hypothetical protein EOP83_01735 [Verrucomicrobiaceae bacterium]|nr:MAG: hypothetical protein EOP83_01735 [Verrucomicrobiaceae bacterium]
MIDTDSVIAFGVEDGEGFIALKGGFEYKVPQTTLDVLVSKYLNVVPLDETVTATSFVDQDI